MWVYPAGSTEELGIAQSVVSRLWHRFQDDGTVSRRFSTSQPRVITPSEDQHIWQLLPKETEGAQHQTCLVSFLQAQKFGDWGDSSGVVLITHPRIKVLRSVPIFPKPILSGSLLNERSILAEFRIWTDNRLYLYPTSSPFPFPSSRTNKRKKELNRMA
ncbi:uncharacterized protein TNCV_2908141 [Trichonephila clavipes]|nr:uncharacterized protein TNCV_2908141 [Trichonephila clavipes]